MPSDAPNDYSAICPESDSVIGAGGDLHVTLSKIRLICRALISPLNDIGSRPPWPGKPSDSSESKSGRCAVGESRFAVHPRRLLQPRIGGAVTSMPADQGLEKANVLGFRTVGHNDAPFTRASTSLPAAEPLEQPFSHARVRAHPVGPKLSITSATSPKSTSPLPSRSLGQAGQGPKSSRMSAMSL